MIEFSLKLLREKEVKEELKKINKKITTFSEPLKISGILMLRSIDQNFRQEGRPTKWIQLKQSTIDARRKGKGRGSPKILQDTGLLRASINFKVDNDSVKISPSSQSTYTKGGNAYDVGAIHQFGAPRRNIPSRSFLLFQKEDINNIENIFIKFMEKNLF